MDIGIDIGGSHIGVGLINYNGKIVKSQERYIADNKDADIKMFIVKEILSILEEWKSNDFLEIDKIGIGAPGIIKDNEIKFSFNLGVFNFKIGEDLKRYYPEAEITVMNDAKCAALAEKKWGSLKDYDDCVFLCLGTGIGGAAFYNGKIVTPQRSAGFEYGHMVIVKDGEPCKCGSRGCFERYGSMRKFKSDIKHNLNIDDSIDGDELLKIVEKNLNNDVVKQTIDNYIKYLCVGISNIINILEPQAICLGGGFVKYKEILLDRLIEALYNSKSIFYKEDMPKIVIAELGNDAGMIGSVLVFNK